MAPTMQTQWVGYANGETSKWDADFECRLQMAASNIDFECRLRMSASNVYPNVSPPVKIAGALIWNF